MADVEPATGDGRMRPVFAGALRDTEGADDFEALRRSINQRHIAGVFIVAVQHTISVDDRAFVSIPPGFVHDLAAVPVEADPIALCNAVEVRAVQIAIDQHHPAVVTVQDGLVPLFRRGA